MPHLFANAASQRLPATAMAATAAASASSLDMDIRMRPRFIEFFAGGGFARLGLGEGWDCVYANDICPKKGATYRANFGNADLVTCDIRDVNASDMPAADLWWASFPCQDHSSAGRKLGFGGKRGSLVFEIVRLLHGALPLGSAPSVVVLENVSGLVTAAGSRDFVQVVTALVSAGYRVGTLSMDADMFVPQSRQRIFIVAAQGHAEVPRTLVRRSPARCWSTKALKAASELLPPTVARQWRWWQMPEPPPRALILSDIVQPSDAPGQRWRSQSNVDELLATMGASSRSRLEAASTAGHVLHGTVSNKLQVGKGERSRRLLLRMDGVAGCLMGKSDLRYQLLCSIDGGEVGIRPFTAIELGRLMGLPADYALPSTLARTARLTGDGVVVPVVRWLAGHLLEPLVRRATDATAASHPGADASAVARNDVTPRPRTSAGNLVVGEGAGTLRTEKADIVQRSRMRRRRKEIAPGDGVFTRGVKANTNGTTAYFLPEELARAHRLANRLGVSLHETVIRGLDRLYAEVGEGPVRRIPTRRGSDGATKPNP